MKRITMAAVGGIVLAAAGIAMAQPHGMFRADTDGDGAVTRAEFATHLGERFARLDADGDGSVTEAEAEAARQARHRDRFERMDADGDGAITLDEMQAAHERRGGRHGGRGERIWNALDSDGDGAVSRAEMEARALARFERMDADGDGRITEAERRDHRPRRHP